MSDWTNHMTRLLLKPEPRTDGGVARAEAGGSECKASLGYIVNCLKRKKEI